MSIYIYIHIYTAYVYLCISEIYDSSDTETGGRKQDYFVIKILAGKKKKNNKTSVPMKGYSIISRHSWISCKCALQILAQPLKKVKKNV